MKKPTDSFEIAVTVPGPARPVFERAIGTLADAVAAFEDGSAWRVAGYATVSPDRAQLQSLVHLAASVAGIPPPKPEVTRLGSTDWVRQPERLRPPIHAGRFFVFGSHDRGLAPAGTFPLEIEAGLAFGTGAHETTKTMLVLLDRLSLRRRFYRPLDLGTGSGVLAMAIASAWKVPVVATDCDTQALDVARENSRENGLSPFLRLVASDGFANPALHHAAPFDLIVANLFARPLRRIAGDMAAHAQQGAILLLSGLLVTQENQVFQRYRQAGFALLGRHRAGEWATLALQKGGPCKQGSARLALAS